MPTVEVVPETPSGAPLGTRSGTRSGTPSAGDPLPQSLTGCAGSTAQETFCDSGGRPTQRQLEGQADLVAEKAACRADRKKRIKTIQDALAKGTYNVDASEVAAKLITRLIED